MLLRIAAISAALAVAAGAFGAHGLRNVLTPARLEVWQTASHYHLVMSAVLVALGLAVRTSDAPMPLAAWLLLAGVVVFSGSLYLLCLTNRGILGAVTPIGGTLLIAGFIVLAVRGI
jgi:uncharacterized membrane protein YgdD (TMEM256/DUF423 family)